MIVYKKCGKKTSRSVLDFTRNAAREPTLSQSRAQMRRQIFPYNGNITAFNLKNTSSLTNYIFSIHCNTEFSGDIG